MLVSGRWFSAPGSEGPWGVRTVRALPADFASIPDESPMENVKASVPGTQQAQEAVVSNSIPQTSAVEIAKVKPAPVSMDGQPQMKAVEGTSLQYVVNASSPIITVTPGFKAAINSGWPFDQRFLGSIGIDQTGIHMQLSAPIHQPRLHALAYRAHK